MSDKQIKISFVVVDSEKAKRAIDELTSSLERLAKASQAAGGGGITTERTVIGQGGSDHANKSGSAKAGSAPVGQKVGILPSILGDTDSASIGRLVSATTSGFSRVSSSVKTFVNSTSQDVNKLNASIESLNKSMNSVRGGAGGGGAGRTLMGMGPGHGAGGGGVGGPGHTIPGIGGSPEANVLAAPAKAAAAGQGGGRQGGRLGAVAALTPLIGEATGGVGSGLMGAMGRFTPIGLGIAAAGMLYNAGADLTQQTKLAQLDYTINEAHNRRGQAASLASMYHSDARSLMHGSVSLSMGIIEAEKDKKAKADIVAAIPLEEDRILRQEGWVNSNKVKQLAKQGMSEAGAALANATKEQGNAQIHFLAKLKTRDFSATANANDPTMAPGDYNEKMGYNRNGVGLRKMSEFDIKQRQRFIEGTMASANAKAGMDLTATTTSKSEEDIQREKAKIQANQDALRKENERAHQAAAALNPYLADTADERYAGALGAVASARHGFRSVRDIKDKDGKTTGYSDMDLEERLLKRGLSIGEYDSARGGIAGAGMGYLPHFDAGGMSLASQGGLQGITSMIKAGGMMSGSIGGAKSLYNLAHELIGGRGNKRGLDTTVGSELFSGLTQRSMGLAAGGAFGGGGIGGGMEQYFRAAASVVGGQGQDVARQSLNLALLNTGMAQYSAQREGKTSKFHDHRKMLRMMDMADGDLLAARRFGEISTEQMIGIANGDEIPAHLKALGMTREKAQNDLKKSNTLDPFAGEAHLYKGEQQSLYESIKKHGSLGQALDAADPTQREHLKVIAETMIGAAGVQAALVASPDAAKRAQATGGRVSSDTGRGSKIIKEALKTKGKVVKDKGTELAKNEDKVAEAIKSIPGQAKEKAAQGEQAGAAIPNISQNVQAFANSLADLVNVMRAAVDAVKAQ